jgi:hypothetical protein
MLEGAGFTSPVRLDTPPGTPRILAVRRPE